jgi:hypothetical protein
MTGCPAILAPEITLVTRAPTAAAAIYLTALGTGRPGSFLGVMESGTK